MNYLNLLIIIVVMPAIFALLISALMQKNKKSSEFTFKIILSNEENTISDSLPEVIFK